MNDNILLDRRKRNLIDAIDKCTNRLLKYSSAITNQLADNGVPSKRNINLHCYWSLERLRLEKVYAEAQSESWVLRLKHLKKVYAEMQP